MDEVDRQNITRTLLTGVVRGLPDTQIREWLRQDLRNTEVGGAEIARLRRLILEEHHELEYFLEDPTIRQLAGRLGQDENHLIRNLITDEIDATSGQAIRNVLEGRRRGQPVWAVLRTLGRTERDRELLASESPGPEAMELLRGWPTTFAGRVDRAVICTQTRAAEFLTYADEIRQSVAYEIVANGWKLSAVIDDEFIIEVPTESNDVAESLTAVVERAIRPELGGIANNCCSVRETSLV